jgi:hypothetical protein
MQGVHTRNGKHSVKGILSVSCGYPYQNLLKLRKDADARILEQAKAETPRLNNSSACDDEMLRSVGRQNTPARHFRMSLASEEKRRFTETSPAHSKGEVLSRN